MIDISLCQNEECGKKDQCYRYNAEADPDYQSYGWFECDKNGDCKYFILDRSD